MYKSSSTYVKPQNFIPIVGAFVGGGDISKETQSLTVSLSRGGVVKDYTFFNDAKTSQIQMHGPTSYSITPK